MHDSNNEITGRANDVILQAAFPWNAGAVKLSLSGQQ